MFYRVLLLEIKSKRGSVPFGIAQRIQRTARDCLTWMEQNLSWSHRKHLRVPATSRHQSGCENGSISCAASEVCVYEEGGRSPSFHPFSVTFSMTTWVLTTQEPQFCSSCISEWLVFWIFYTVLVQNRPGTSLWWRVFGLGLVSPVLPGAPWSLI